jgi:hypothetical protein
MPTVRGGCREEFLRRMETVCNRVSEKKMVSREGKWKKERG